MCAVYVVLLLLQTSFGKFPPGHLADHGEQVAAALLSSSSSSTNGTSSEAHANGNGSSNGNGTALAAVQAAAAAIPISVVPPELIPEVEVPWTAGIRINGDDSSVLGEGVIAVAADGTKMRHPVRPPVVHR